MGKFLYIWKYFGLNIRADSSCPPPPQTALLSYGYVLMTYLPLQFMVAFDCNSVGWRRESKPRTTMQRNIATVRKPHVAKLTTSIQRHWIDRHERFSA